MPKSKEDSSKCRVCSAPNSMLHYGVKSCHPCKVFFKRNATNEKKTLKCDFDDQCEINLNNRHVCSACRLKKCFEVGMCVEMIRGSHGKKGANVSQSSALVPFTPRRNVQPQQLRTLNLLEQDQSLLTGDQWALLSNLIHSYDEHNAVPIAQSFMKELDSKPPKLRFKIDSTKIKEIVNVCYQMTEPFIRSNQHFALLPADDRSIVCHGAVDNVSCLGGAFLLRQSGLITNPAFCQGLEITFGSLASDLTLTMVSLLDQDVDVVKLAISLFAFCTSTCTSFNDDRSSNHVENYQTVLGIQHMYAEIIWKYLLYRYNFTQAVKRFTQLIQCLVVAFTVRANLQTTKNHTDAVDSLIEKIEQQHINVDHS